MTQPSQEVTDAIENAFVFYEERVHNPMLRKRFSIAVDRLLSSAVVQQYVMTQMNIEPLSFKGNIDGHIYPYNWRMAEDQLLVRHGVRKSTPTKETE